MADLTGTTPADTYKGLLQVNDYTDGVAGNTGSNALVIQDGAGNATALAISTDNVGIGTTSPGGPLHVYNTTANQLNLTRAINVIGISGGASAEIHGGALAATSPSMGGVIGFSLKDSDGTGSGGSTEGMIYFKTKDSGTGLTEKMRIDSDGNVGIGTTSPESKLHLQDVVGFSQTINLKNTVGTHTEDAVSGGKAWQWEHGVEGDNTGYDYHFKNKKRGSSSYDDVMTLKSDGNVGIGTTDPGSYKLHVLGTLKIYGGSYVDSVLITSDDRVKHNEQSIVGAIETLGKITPKKYIKTKEMYGVDHNFKLDADGNPIDENGEPVEHHVEAGVIAQQVLTVDELAFAVNPEVVDEDGNVTSPYSLDYNSLFTYAIAAIQEQQQIIDELKSQNESQQSIINDLASRIETLENK